MTNPTEQKTLTLHEAAELGPDFMLYIPHDAEDVYVYAVRESVMDKILTKYEADHLSDLYEHPDDIWEDVETELLKDSYEIEALTIQTY